MLRKIIPAAALVLSVLTLSVSAAAPYRSYYYDENGVEVPMQTAYTPVKELTGDDLGVGAFSNPQDFFVDREHDLLYVSDTDNARVLVFNRELEHVRTIDAIQTATLPDGLMGVVGLYVDEEETLYMAQRDGNSVAIVDKNGMLVNYLTKPVSGIFPENNMFQPKKVLCDNAGRILVLVDGIYQGAAVFSRDAEFLGFYGGNKVERTAEVIADFFWRRFQTEEQIDASTRIIPTEYENFCISGDFIYTVSQSDISPEERIKKLNPAGIDVMNEEAAFGDLETYTVNNTEVDTSFVDIAVDEAGYIYALDMTRGRVFQYDSEGNLLFTYGGIGSQTGTFRQTVAIEKWGDEVLVLDQLKGTITFFERTAFGDSVIEAVTLYNDGFYEEAEEYWRDVLMLDSHYNLAYDGIGKSMYNQARYEEACDYFRTSGNNEWYSKAYKELRIINMRKIFPYAAAAIIVSAAGVITAGRLRKRRKAKCK